MQTTIANPVCSQSQCLCGNLLRRVSFSGWAVCCLLVAGPLQWQANANDFKLGPVIDVSDPDVFAGCGSNGAEKESSLAVNPTNPKNMVVAWIGGLFKSIGSAVSSDSGKSWQQVIIPGLSICNGGTQDFDENSDPWLSFGPNGTLHFACVANSSSGLHSILAARSSDGGLHWSTPARLFATTDQRSYPDKPSITADPTDARYAYAVWVNCDNGNRGGTVLARTTDGGVSWEPARTIYDPSSANNGTGGPIINVLPNGTLVAVLTEFKFKDGGVHKGALLSVIRSTDKGQTWSGPIRVAAMPVFRVTDPETGHGLNNSSSCCPNPAVAMDANNGNLYITWEDNGFSGGQYSSIAFSMSADGGFTWSAPIQVNKTPTNIAPGNRQAFIPAVAVSADGTIGVSYYDFRYNDTSAGLPTDYWLVHCHPSSTRPASDPANWGSEIRLTDASFDLQIQTALANYFLGDYEWLATSGNDFLAAWANPHDSDLNSVFFRRVGP